MMLLLITVTSCRQDKISLPDVRNVILKYIEDLHVDGKPCGFYLLSPNYLCRFFTLPAMLPL